MRRSSETILRLCFNKPCEILSVLRSQSRWSLNHFGPGAGAEISFNTFSSFTLDAKMKRVIPTYISIVRCLQWQFWVPFYGCGLRQSQVQIMAKVGVRAKNETLAPQH